MASYLTKLLVMSLILLDPLTMGGIVGSGNRVWAQAPAGGGERSEERRPRWRRFGDSERGRSSRGEGGDSSRGDRPTGSGSTSNDSTRTSSTTPTPAASSSSPATSSGSSSSSTKPAGSSSSGSMALTEYAKSLVKQHDKNGDMMLQPEERKELKGRAAEADLNPKDGVITIDELVAHLSPNAPTPAAGSTSPQSATADSSSSDSPSSSLSTNRSGSESTKANTDASKRVFYGSAGGSAASTKDGDKRRTYRFMPASERLPSGLPSWFTSKDSNRDGQVQMSEYSRFWTKSTLTEFRRYDLNEDGIITPKEVSKQR